MIMLGLYVTDDIPFKDVYMHGMVLDEKGQKMSKSKGNVINPMSVVGEYGSDALRLGLIASRSAGVNQAFSKSKVIASRNLCNKLWNVSRLIQQWSTTMLKVQRRKRNTNSKITAKTGFATKSIKPTGKYKSLSIITALPKLATFSTTLSGINMPTGFSSAKSSGKTSAYSKTL